MGFLNSPDGAPLVGIIAVYLGAIAEGEKVLEPLRKFGSPVADVIRPMPYTNVQRMVDDAVPTGDRYYWKSNFVDDLAPGLASVLTDGAAAMPSPRSMILVFEIKGEIQRVPKHTTAFDHRSVNFEMSIIAHWTDRSEDDANVRWARQYGRPPSRSYRRQCTPITWQPMRHRIAFELHTGLTSMRGWWT